MGTGEEKLARKLPKEMLIFRLWLYGVYEKRHCNRGCSPEHGLMCNAAHSLNVDYKHNIMEITKVDVQFSYTNREKYNHKGRGTEIILAGHFFKMICL